MILPITQYIGLVTKSGIVLGKHLTPDPITDMYLDISVSIRTLTHQITSIFYRAPVKSYDVGAIFLGHLKVASHKYVLTTTAETSMYGVGITE